MSEDSKKHLENRFEETDKPLSALEGTKEMAAGMSGEAAALIQEDQREEYGVNQQVN